MTDGTSEPPAGQTESPHTAAPELMEELRAIAAAPISRIVAFLRDRAISNRDLSTVAALMPDQEQLALYRALFELRPSIPEEASWDERSCYAWAVSAASASALRMGDSELSVRIIEPFLRYTTKFPFLGHQGACVLAKIGRPAEALAQMKLAADSGYDQMEAMEQDEDLESLRERPDFREIFQVARDRRIASVLTCWPVAVPVPARLADLALFMSKSGASPTFGDFEMRDLTDDFLYAAWNREDSELFKQFPPKLAFFARDGGGGQVALWMVTDEPEQWPVVWLDSEGQTNILGDNLDDFLCLLAGHWHDDRYEHLAGDDAFRAWVRGLGLVPHPHSEGRLEDLTKRTLEFLRWFAEDQRTVSARLFPERPLVIEARPKDRVGAVRLGAPQAEVDGALGPPTFATHSKGEQLTAFYPHTPYVVEYREATRTVASVTLYAQRIVVRLQGGFEPLYATEAEAEVWLHAQGVDFTKDDRTLIVPALGLSLSLNTGMRHGEDCQPRWVDGITFALALG